MEMSDLLIIVESCRSPGGNADELLKKAASADCSVWCRGADDYWSRCRTRKAGDCSHAWRCARGGHAERRVDTLHKANRDHCCAGSDLGRKSLGDVQSRQYGDRCSRRCGGLTF